MVEPADPFLIVELEQGSPPWLAWRRGGVGASDAPTIMGENPWKSPAQLRAEKLTSSGVEPNAAMLRGTALEPEARQRFEAAKGIQVAPACVESRRHSWMRASIDGLNLERRVVVEIKCGGRVYEFSSARRQVPDYYCGQLQHILAVTGLPRIDFWCWIPGRPDVHLTVDRDDRYISRLVEAERAFWLEVERDRR